MRTGGVSTSGWRNTILLNREVIRACRANGIHTSWFKILSKYPAKVMGIFSRMTILVTGASGFVEQRD